MAARVYQKRRVNRTLFRKLPAGSAYWASSDFTVAPVIKRNRTTSLHAFTVSTGASTGDTVTPTTTAVARVPGQFIGRRMS
jgi:hypothetical protein